MQRSQRARVFTERDIEHLYRGHPLSKKSILRRSGRKKSRKTSPTEPDLAIDPVTEITDQNHVGGVSFVKTLARRAGVSPDSRVLDLGAGLGGSARYLAHSFGCHVHGIELSRQRYREAVCLTRCVGLQDLVSFERGDMSKLRLGKSAYYDVLWGQSSWVHIRAKDHFLRRWMKALRVGGRIAFEEAYIRRIPRSKSIAAKLSELQELWKSYLVPLRVWTKILVRLSVAVSSVEDTSGALRRLYSRMLRIDRQPGAPVFPDSERRAWVLAVELERAGILGYFRIVGEKRK